MAAEDGLVRGASRSGVRIGLALLGGGILLLTIAGGFFGYQAYIDSRYEPVVSIAAAPRLPTQQELVVSSTKPNTQPAFGDAVQADTGGGTADAGTLADIYVGTDVAPQAWDNPLWAAHRGQEELARTYLPVSDLDLPPAGLSPATRVRIPLIDVDADTIALQVLELEEGIKYESPVFDIGIIPGRTNPGELGNTWLFGHLESPLKGEGAVFKDLPNVHDFLRRGEAVYVIVDSEDGSFLYQATEFRIMHQDDVHFWGSEGRIATLVCSWPRFKYDERVVVTAELVGARLNPDGAVS